MNQCAVGGVTSFAMACPWQPLQHIENISERHTDRQTDRQTDKQTDRQTEKSMSLEQITMSLEQSSLSQNGYGSCLYGKVSLFFFLRDYIASIVKAIQRVLGCAQELDASQRRNS